MCVRGFRPTVHDRKAYTCVCMCVFVGETMCVIGRCVRCSVRRKEACSLAACTFASLMYVLFEPKINLSNKALNIIYFHSCSSDRSRFLVYAESSAFRFAMLCVPLRVVVAACVVVIVVGVVGVDFSLWHCGLNGFGRSRKKTSSHSTS